MGPRRWGVPGGCQKEEMRPCPAGLRQEEGLLPGVRLLRGMRGWA